MGKSLIDETFEVYMQMRIGGKEAKAALEALRFRIQIMPNNDQAELVRLVKAWEGQHMGAETAPAKPRPTTPAKLSSANGSRPPITDLMMPPSSHELENSPLRTSASAPASASAANTVICTRCGKGNTATEVFCTNCGNFLRTEQAVYETTRLDDPDMISHGADFFSAEFDSGAGGRWYELFLQGSTAAL